MKERFIALNILPPSMFSSAIFEDFKRQIEQAKAHQFKYVWLNPICMINSNKKCWRRDLDTGLMTYQYQSLYDYQDPQSLNAFFDNIKVQQYIADLNKEGFPVVVDFAWMYVGNFGVFNQTTPCDQQTLNQEIENAKAVIDYYLGTLKFSGLRIDGASHIKPEVRIALYEYIRKKYPKSVIFEEVLFDRTQASNVEQLVNTGKEKKIFSDFVTSNIFYKTPDETGFLPAPKEMGDLPKLELSQGNGIGFTGNHDHHSVGWCTVLYMALKRLKENPGFIDKVSRIGALARNKESKDVQHFRGFKGLLAELEAGTRTIEGVSGDERNYCIRLLLPFALEIAKELLQGKDQELLKEFKRVLLQKIIDRTLTSPSGYFLLSCELDFVFQTQRIFTNKSGMPLELPILSVDDLIDNKGLILELWPKIVGEGELDNVKNFLRNVKLPGGDLDKKAPKKVSKKKTSTKDSNEEIDKDDMRILLPYVLEYLRNNPQELKRFKVSIPSSLKEEVQFSEALGLKDFIKQINNIYSQLLTMTCSDYQTFISQTDFKIIIRHSEKSTDIIVMNTGTLSQPYAMTREDMEKIALWYQARCCSPKSAGFKDKVLNDPFDGKPVKYYDEGYSSYWGREDSDKFNNAYSCIMGQKKGHRTTLYVGGSITAKSEELLAVDTQRNPLGHIRVVLGYKYGLAPLIFQQYRSLFIGYNSGSIKIWGCLDESGSDALDENVSNKKEDQTYLLQSHDINYVAESLFASEGIKNVFFIPAQQNHIGYYSVDLERTLNTTVTEKLEQGMDVASIFNKGSNHWVAYKIVKTSENTVTVFYKDSYGKPPPKAFTDAITKGLGKYKVDFVSSNSVEQNLDTSFGPIDRVNCGIFALNNLVVLAKTDNEKLLSNVEVLSNVEDGHTKVLNSQISFYSPGNDDEKYAEGIKVKRQEFAVLYEKRSEEVLVDITKRQELVTKHDELHAKPLLEKLKKNSIINDLLAKGELAIGFITNIKGDGVQLCFTLRRQSMATTDLFEKLLKEVGIEFSKDYAFGHKNILIDFNKNQQGMQALNKHLTEENIDKLSQSLESARKSAPSELFFDQSFFSSYDLWNLDALDENICSQKGDNNYLLQSHDINFIAEMLLKDKRNIYFVPVQQNHFTDYTIDFERALETSIAEQLAKGKDVVSIFNKGSNHWVAYKIAKTAGNELTVFYKDSYGDNCPQKFKQAIEEAFKGTKVNFVYSSSEEQIRSKALEEGDGVNCGIFALRNAEFLAETSNDVLLKDVTQTPGGGLFSKDIKFYSPGSKSDYYPKIIQERQDLAALYSERSKQIDTDGKERRELVGRLNDEVATPLKVKLTTHHDLGPILNNENLAIEFRTDVEGKPWLCLSFKDNMVDKAKPFAELFTTLKIKFCDVIENRGDVRNIFLSGDDVEKFSTALEGDVSQLLQGLKGEKSYVLS